MIPFKGAIFDLDGTLLDSLGVWRDVDAAFFAARGIPQAADYGWAIRGMSFSECAEYTVKRFGLNERPEDVMDEWMRMTAAEYAHHVPLKPGAREYLRMLRRAGVKLAVATANRREVFAPCLERCGILELFDALCTSGDVGDGNKADGVLFRHAAAQIGVEPEACAVFEDTQKGLIGAKAAGMRAYAVRDALSSASGESFGELADGTIEGFDDMRAYHAFPDNARRCVIFTARCEGDPREAYAPRPDDCVLCADGGWQVAARAGVAPDVAVGDFDSSEAPEGVRVERFPVEKDDTDTMLCLKKGLAMGLDDFLIVGGFGGRLDHTLANLQALNYAAARGARAEMADGGSWATVLRGGSVRVPRRPGKLSVFAMGDRCAGVTIRGAKYETRDAVITSAFPLGMGNDFDADAAEISVAEGALLVLVCREM